MQIRILIHTCKRRLFRVWGHVNGTSVSNPTYRYIFLHEITKSDMGYRDYDGFDEDKLILKLSLTFLQLTPTLGKITTIGNYGLKGKTEAKFLG